MANASIFTPEEEQIINAIIPQRIRVGQKVTEALLTDMFGFSRSVGRSAVQRLCSLRLLEDVSPRITVVPPVTLLEVRQNFALRRMVKQSSVEQYAVLQAAVYDAATETLTELETLIGASDDDTIMQAMRLNRRYNQLLFSHSPFPLERQWQDQLEVMASRIYFEYWRMRRTTPYSLKNAHDLIAIMRAGEIEAAQRNLVNALFQSEAAVLEAFTQSPHLMLQSVTAQTARHPPPG